MKKVDSIWDDKIKPGFEMLVNNFSAGIVGGRTWRSSAFTCSARSSSASPTAFGNGVNWLIEHSLLPLASIIIEPAKVLFLNNAINHGVLTPLGIQQSAAEGKSILFLLEANPGPGLGLLIAYSHLRHRAGEEHRAGRGDHPVLRRHPRDLLPVRADEADPELLATIAGGMVGIFTLTIFDAGLRAPGRAGVDHRGASCRRRAAASSGWRCRCCSPRQHRSS